MAVFQQVSEAIFFDETNGGIERSEELQSIVLSPKFRPPVGAEKPRSPVAAVMAFPVCELAKVKDLAK